MIILEFILNNTYTKIEDKYYQQTSGLGTGSCTSTAYADIIVDWTYTQAISLSVISPKLLKTYVDDCYLLWPDKEDTFLKFKDLINSIWPSLNFTHQFSNSKNQLPFLDMNMVIDTTNEKLYYEFYQKPTHSGRYLHYSSHCAMSTKINIIKTEARRIIKNCMYKQHSWPHLEKSREDFIQSGYPEHLVTMHIIKTIKNSRYVIWNKRLKKKNENSSHFI